MGDRMQLEVLIVDDDRSFAKVLGLKLKSFIGELNINCCENLKSARAFMSSEHPPLDLVILDEHLPDGRGVELLKEGCFSDLAVLCVSSDTSPEIPGSIIKAGATYFLNKLQVSEALFEPLVCGVIDRNKLQQQLSQAKIDLAVMETVKTLLATLRHEINNPLGAVLGAAYILRQDDLVKPEQKQAAELVESSGQRIKHVLLQLCEAVELEEVSKGRQKVFHIPGDKEWQKDE